MASRNAIPPNSTQPNVTLPSAAPPSRARAAVVRAYARLLDHYGPQGWWPPVFPSSRRRDTPSADEIAIGAVLVQHTSWRNVESALAELAERRWVTLDAIARATDTTLAEAISAAGPPRVKAKRLQSLAHFASQRGGLRRFLDGVDNAAVAWERREALLCVHGIGPETADVILLYAGGAPLAVVDAYARRVLGRHGWHDPGDSYAALQRFFGESFPADPQTLNELHALIVRVGVDHCRAGAPKCEACPLKRMLPRGGPRAC